MKRLNLAEWAIRHRQIIYFFIINNTYNITN